MLVLLVLWLFFWEKNEKKTQKIGKKMKFQKFYMKLISFILSV